jgi:hypothetical protein
MKPVDAPSVHPLELPLSALFSFVLLSFVVVRALLP